MFISILQVTYGLGRYLRPSFCPQFGVYQDRKCLERESPLTILQFSVIVSLYLSLISPVYFRAFSPWIGSEFQRTYSTSEMYRSFSLFPIGPIFHKIRLPCRTLFSVSIPKFLVNFLYLPSYTRVLNFSYTFSFQFR